MRTMNTGVLVAALAAALAVPGVAGESPDPTVKALPAPLDPGEKTVLIGRSLAEDMIIQLELEPAKAMWMAATASVQLQMDQSNGTWMVLATPPMWSEHSVAKGELYHVEVKPIDPRSKTRISYASVTFKAVNKDNGRKVEGILHPMWGGSGLHYALNSGLAGDGAYEAMVTVDAPTFARELKDKGRWIQPATAKFHFRLAEGKLTEVSEPAAENASD